MNSFELEDMINESVALMWDREFELEEQLEEIEEPWELD
jgi:hypothetical protein